MLPPEEKFQLPSAFRIQLPFTGVGIPESSAGLPTYPPELSFQTVTLQVASSPPARTRMTVVPLLTPSTSPLSSTVAMLGLSEENTGFASLPSGPSSVTES